MAQAKSDNPLENATLSKLAKIEAGGPYEYVTRNGKNTITFPDLAKMDWEEGEQFMQDMSTLPESRWLPKYLSTPDWERFRQEKLNMGEMVVVLRDVMNHYQEVFGTPGEEGTSQS